MSLQRPRAVKKDKILHKLRKVSSTLQNVASPAWNKTNGTAEGQHMGGRLGRLHVAMSSTWSPKWSVQDSSTENRAALLFTFVYNCQQSAWSTNEVSKRPGMLNLFYTTSSRKQEKYNVTNKMQANIATLSPSKPISLHNSPVEKKRICLMKLLSTLQWRIKTWSLHSFSAIFNATLIGS